MGGSVKISVIMASYNSERYIEGAIKSITDQNYTNWELIIIDGGSKDHTIELIQKYDNNIAYWISERDEGIYDAWNKGVRRAKGDWIMFLGSDDYLLPGAFEKYANFVATQPADTRYISARIQMVDEHMKPIRVKGWAWEWPQFLNMMTVAHPGSLHSRQLFEKYGEFDTNYKIVGDYEFLLRPRQNLKAAFLNEVTVAMREGGASDSIRAIKEHMKASIVTGGSNKVSAQLNAFLVYLKFKAKKSFRKLGVNAYLKH